jgi:hypothetical protein
LPLISASPSTEIQEIFDGGLGAGGGVSLSLILTLKNLSASPTQAQALRIDLLMFPPIADKERVHLLKNLEHFLSSLLSSKEFYAALIGAVIGGLMAGRYALRTQKQAAKDQRQRDLEIEQRAVKGTLQAIATELKVLKASALDPLDKHLKDLTKARELAARREGPEPHPFVKSRIEKNYFIIFESNAAMLGRINDEQLRREIISVYGFANGLIDELNVTFPEYQIWRNTSDNLEKKISAAMLAGFEDTIRINLKGLQRDLGDLLPKIEKYLDF